MLKKLSEEHKNRIRLACLKRKYKDYKGKIIKICEQCKKEFKVFPYVKDRARFCSIKCRKSGVGKDKRMDKHFAWKGNKASYNAFHKWMNNNFGRPDTCEHCGKSGLKGRQIHWANISAKYLRKRSDWLRLCKDCHWEYDGNKRRIFTKCRTSLTGN